MYDRWVAREEVTDFRFAQLASILANAHFKKRDGKQFQIKDFMVFKKPEKPKTREQEIAEQKLFAIAMTRAMGGKVVIKHGSGNNNS